MIPINFALKQLPFINLDENPQQNFHPESLSYLLKKTGYQN